MLTGRAILSNLGPYLFSAVVIYLVGRVAGVW